MNFDCDMIYIERKQFEIVIQSQITGSLLNFTIDIFGVVPTLISDWLTVPNSFIYSKLFTCDEISYMQNNYT